MSEPILTPAKPGQEAFSLGDWRVDPELNQLSEIANLHHRRTLEPRLMHLLCYLAANSGRVLTREQLTSELWPRVIVNENSLTRAVSELRRQLAAGDRSGTDYLQTIPKRGYRLICSPEPIANPVNEQPMVSDAALATTAKTPPGWHRPMLVTACLVLAALAISFDFTAGPPEIVELPTNGLVYDQVVGETSTLLGGKLSLSSLNGEENISATDEFRSTSALSPDGSVLALVRHEGGLSTIYLARPDLATEPVAIFSSDEILYNLSWSPVGNALLFARQSPSLFSSLLAERGQHADLVMLDLDTLSLQVLIDNTPQPRTPAAV